MILTLSLFSESMCSFRISSTACSHLIKSYRANECGTLNCQVLFSVKSFVLFFHHAVGLYTLPVKLYFFTLISDSTITASLKIQALTRYEQQKMPSKQDLQFPLKNKKFFDQSSLFSIASISPFFVVVLSYPSALSFYSYSALVLSLNVPADT